MHGHTFLQTDRHCGLIETEAGKSDLAKHARVKHPFTVVVMKTPDYENM
jgi:hypothetical protein